MAKDAKVKAKARALVEEGQSLRDVAQAVGTSFTSVKNWAKKEGWEKGKAAPKLAQKAADAIEAQAERRGITRAKVLDKVAELIDAQSVAVITTQGAVSLCPMGVDAKVSKGKADFMGIEYDVVPDRKTQLAAAQLAADVLGMKKIEINPSDDLRSLFQSMRGPA